MSLIVSVFLVGVKVTAVKELVVLVERRKELKANLSLLLRKLEDDDLADWLGDIALDVVQREEAIDAIAADQVHTVVEDDGIDRGIAIFAQYDNSSAPVTQLKRSVTITRSETKLDEAGRLLLGRAEAEVPAEPKEIIAYSLNYDGRHIQSDQDQAVDVRVETVAKLNDHHVIIFNRKKLGSGLRDRTFLNAVIAKKVAETPPTYVLVVVPLKQHPKITPKDEAGAVRAESFRSYRFTEVSPGRTKIEYCCSLSLNGWVPQLVTNKLAIPQQVFYTHTHTHALMSDTPP